MSNAGSLAKDPPLPGAKRTKHQQPAVRLTARDVNHNAHVSCKGLNLQMECRLEICSQGYNLMHRVGRLASEGLVMIAQGSVANPINTPSEQPQETAAGLWALTAHHFREPEKPCLILSEVQCPPALVSMNLLPMNGPEAMSSVSYRMTLQMRSLMSGSIIARDLAQAVASSSWSARKSSAIWASLLPASASCISAA